MWPVTRPGLDRISAILPEVCRQVGTPVYLYDWPSLVSAVNWLTESAHEAGLDDNSFHVAFFAAPNLRLVERIIGNRKDLGINCNSAEEIEALRVSGWRSWDRVVFTGGVLPRRELASVAATGCLVNVASIGNLLILLEENAPARLGLRLDFTGTALKGIRPQDVTVCFGLAAKVRRRIEALHAYPGTEVLALERMVRHAELLVSLAGQWPEVSQINFGGGFGYDYAHRTGRLADMIDLRGYFADVRALTTQIDRKMKLAWEPGRVVFAGAGFFAMEILEVRETGLKSGDLYVDASFTNIPALKLLNRQHEVVVVDVNGRIKHGRAFQARVCGSTTLSSDLILPNPCIIPDVVPGDYLVILDVGAYGRAGSYGFLGKALPPEVLVNHDRWETIRDRLALDHLLAGLPANV